MTICPSETDSRPAVIRSVVDLPHPDGPRSAINSPSRIFRSSRSERRRQIRPVLLDQLFVKELSHVLNFLGGFCGPRQELLGLRIEDDEQMRIDLKLRAAIHFESQMTVHQGPDESAVRSLQGQDRFRSQRLEAVNGRMKRLLDLPRTQCESSGGRTPTWILLVCFSLRICTTSAGRASGMFSPSICTASCEPPDDFSVASKMLTSGSPKNLATSIDAGRK